jgi:hypothetical protein
MGDLSKRIAELGRQAKALADELEELHRTHPDMEQIGEACKLSLLTTIFALNDAAGILRHASLTCITFAAGQK